jgi:hypothetical protein
MTRRSSSAATATRDDDFKIARCLGIRASDMSGIDADDELVQGIVQHAELKLCALGDVRAGATSQHVTTLQN